MTKCNGMNALAKPCGNFRQTLSLAKNGRPRKNCCAHCGHTKASHKAKGLGNKRKTTRKKR